MKFLLMLRAAVAGSLTRLPARILQSFKSGLGRFFYTRPALKRAGLVLVLQAPVLLPLMLMARFGGPGLLGFALTLGFAVWSALLLGLFLGIGAERACSDWDDIFALPPIHSFAPWRWHALERKRFIATIASLLAGAALALGAGFLP